MLGVGFKKNKTKTSTIYLSPCHLFQLLWVPSVGTPAVLGEILELASYLLLLQESAWVWFPTLPCNPPPTSCERCRGRGCRANAEPPALFLPPLVKLEWTGLPFWFHLTVSKPRPHTECTTNATSRQAVNACTVGTVACERIVADAI